METFHLADRPSVAQAIAAAAACDTLEELQAAVAAYDGTETARAKTATPSYPTATPNPLMIVSEKPEPEDLETGRPFSGEYGAVMREVLGWTGLDLDAVHVAYAVHWTPDGEKPLNATAISSSRPFLFREIELVRPRAILMPGRGVYEALFNRRDPVGQMLNLTLDWRRGDLRIPCRMVNHPAYALRFKTEMAGYAEQLGGFVHDFARPDEILSPVERMKRAA